MCITDGGRSEARQWHTSVCRHEEGERRNWAWVTPNPHDWWDSVWSHWIHRFQQTRSQMGIPPSWARGRVTRNNNLCYPSRPCRYKTLMFGISSAAEKYQKVISDVIRSCSGVVNIADDLIVHGSDLAEHDWNLHAVLQRLRESGLSLNGEKCRLTFFGHDLSSEGVVPSEEDCCSCECS